MFEDLEKAGKKGLPAYENKQIGEFADITARKTQFAEVLSPEEQHVFKRFEAQREMNQLRANNTGVPLYFVYQYARGEPDKGTFKEIEPDHTQPGLTQLPTLIPLENAKVGPIFCVYPESVQESVTVNEHGIPAAGTIKIGDNFLLEDYRNPESYEETKVEVKTPSLHLYERGVLLAFANQLLRVQGDEEMRQLLVTCKGNDFSCVLPHIATSSKALRQLAIDPSGQLIGLTLLSAASGAVMTGLSPSDALKYSLVMGGSTIDLTVVDGTFSEEAVVEWVFSKDQKSRMKPQASYEKYVEAEVHEALRAAKVPKNSVVLGSLPELLQSVELGIQHLFGDELQLTVTIQQFGAVLKAVKSYGLEFIGATLPYVSANDTKATPAIASSYAKLPYPRMDIVAVTKDGEVHRSTLNNGDEWQAVGGNEGHGVFVHEVGSSRRQGIGFIPQEEVGSFVPTKNGAFVVMPMLELHDRERRTIFHPGLGLLFVQDRNVPERKLRSGDLETKKHIERKSLPELSPKEREEYEKYLRALDHQVIVRVIGDSELALEQVDRVRKLYEGAGIHPTLGIYGYDFLWALRNTEKISELQMFQDGIPFVSEMHSIMSMDEESLLAVGAKLLQSLREKYKNRDLVIPNSEVTCLTQMLAVVLEQEMKKGDKSKVDWNKLHMRPETGKPYRPLLYNKRSGVAQIQEQLQRIVRYTDMRQRRIFKTLGIDP